MILNIKVQVDFKIADILDLMAWKHPSHMYGETLQISRNALPFGSVICPLCSEIYDKRILLRIDYLF